MEMPQGTHSVHVGPRLARLRLSTIDTARVVAALTDQWGPPSVRQVADCLGISRPGAHKRLLAAADAGWLDRRGDDERVDRGAFKASERLLRLLDDEAGA